MSARCNHHAEWRVSVFIHSPHSLLDPLFWNYSNSETFMAHRYAFAKNFENALCCLLRQMVDISARGVYWVYRGVRTSRSSPRQSSRDIDEASTPDVDAVYPTAASTSTPRGFLPAEGQEETSVYHRHPRHMAARRRQQRNVDRQRLEFERLALAHRQRIEGDEELRPDTVNHPTRTATTLPYRVAGLRPSRDSYGYMSVTSGQNRQHFAAQDWTQRLDHEPPPVPEDLVRAQSGQLPVDSPHNIRPAHTSFQWPIDHVLTPGPASPHSGNIESHLAVLYLLSYVGEQNSDQAWERSSSSSANEQDTASLTLRRAGDQTTESSSDPEVILPPAYGSWRP